MTIHRRTHPQPVDGCDACRWASVNIGVAALPTRKTFAINHGEWAEQMERDLPAYRQLRADGLQPPRIAGAHERMMTCETPEEVEDRPRLWKDRDEILTGEVPDMGVKDAPAA